MRNNPPKRTNSVRFTELWISNSVSMPNSSQLNPKADARARRLFALALALTAAIFALDLSMPLGIAVCALYGIVILFGLFIDWRGFALSAAGVATLLTTLAAAVKPASAFEVHAIANRALTIVGIWVTAWLVSRYASAGRALDRSVKDLADTNFALNQAAIVATTNVKGEITFVNDKFSRSPTTHARNSSGGITGSSIPAITRRTSSAISGTRSRTAGSGAARSATARRTARSTGSTPRSSRFLTKAESRTNTWRFATRLPIASGRRRSCASRRRSPVLARWPRSSRTRSRILAAVKGAR